MILQKHGWPEDEDAAIEAEQAALAAEGGGEGTSDEEAVAAAALRTLSSSTGGGEGGGGSSEPLEPLHVNQLVRAALRPGGISTTGESQAPVRMAACAGVAFFDGDKVDALPRSLIVPAPSPSKMRARLELEQGLADAAEAEPGDSEVNHAPAPGRK